MEVLLHGSTARDLFEVSDVAWSSGRRSESPWVPGGVPSAKNEPPWVLWRPQSCVLRQCFCLTVFSIERLFELCRWDVSDETMEAILVVPVDPAEGCQLQLFNAFPGSRVVWPSDEFRFVVAVHSFSEGIDAPMSVNS